MGNAKLVTVTGLTLGGADAGNYLLGNSTETTTANVTAASVSPVVTVSNKAYDATVAAAIASRSLTGAVGGDPVSLTGGIAIFDTKNIGVNKTVTVTGLALGGADAGNYSLAFTTASTTANITAASVTGMVTAADKVYDATNAASITRET